nr:cystatin-11 [Castor canadensis]
MGRHWQAPHLLLAILVALVSFTYQARRKTFIRVQEENAVETQVKDTLQYATDMYNKDSDDKYNFRILRILKIEKQVTDHMEYHITVEMQRTTCLKSESSNCAIQKGELRKQIQCYFSVFAIPWFEKYKVLKKNCSDG